MGLSSPAERRLALCARKDLSISRSCAASAWCEEAAARAAQEAKKLPQAFPSKHEGRGGDGGEMEACERKEGGREGERQVIARGEVNCRKISSSK